VKWWRRLFSRVIKEAVILAGGFGTRLSHVLGNVPKPMAPVDGKPFLAYLIDRLADAGVEHVVLATGYRHEVIESCFGACRRALKISYSCESTPLLTGGAIRKACRMLADGDFFVLNGDTLFDIDWQQFAAFHTAQRAPLSVALRRVDDTSRYGAVDCSDGRITAFREKADCCGKGLINGGVYAVQKSWLLGLPLPSAFSFEKQLLQPMAPEGLFRGMVFDRYFIDIGVPQDYFRAQREFAALFPPDCFLFLDRDGVLNRRIAGGYVQDWSQWSWLPGVLSSMPRLADRYGRIFVVSNQQGVGKGLMTMQMLDAVHRQMRKEIEQAGGRLDAVYVCTALQGEGSPDRKPGIGMALRAAADFPEVDFRRSVMVGDSLSDMQFGWRAGMRCVFLASEGEVPVEVRDYTDLSFGSLAGWLA